MKVNSTGETRASSRFLLNGSDSCGSLASLMKISMVLVKLAWNVAVKGFVS